MAHAIRTQGITLSIRARIAEVITNAIAEYQNRRLYRATLDQLRDLSARELDDLGLTRGDLTRVALESTYGRNI